MPMAMVVTRNVEDRYRGFLTSVMLEVAPGVYVAPDLSPGVRTRVWDVLSGWWEALGAGSIVLVWRDFQHDRSEKSTMTIPCAFRAAKRVDERPTENIERVTRRLTGQALVRERVIPAMIDRIKMLFAKQSEEG